MLRGILLSVVLAFSSGPALAFDISEMSDDERAIFRAEIRDYLLENPEVLMEATAIIGLIIRKRSNFGFEIRLIDGDGQLFVKTAAGAVFSRNQDYPVASLFAIGNRSAKTFQYADIGDVIGLQI